MAVIIGAGGHRRAAPRFARQRSLQIALGFIWLADGALQCQPFMFSRSFLRQIIVPNEIAQPGFVADPIKLFAHLVEPRVALFNVLAATIQLLIGLGLIYRPTVKAALLTSFGWALGVWWVGEGLGGLFTGTALPLTGAPGPALLYVLAGLVAWPHTGTRPGGNASGGCWVSREHAGPRQRFGSAAVRCACCPPTAQPTRSTIRSPTRHRAPIGFQASSQASPRLSQRPSGSPCCSIARRGQR